MKETIFQTLRIMCICIFSAVIVSTIAYFVEAEPPKKNKPNFIEDGKSGEHIEIIVQVTEDTEKTDDVMLEHRENEKTAPPFDFDVNVTTKTRFDVLPQNIHHVYQIIPRNSMAVALEELEKRKKYFICFCKRRFCRKFNKIVRPFGQHSKTKSSIKNYK